MVQQLQCKSCDHKLFIENTEKETQRGLGSIFYVRCQECLLLNPVKSSKEYVNPATVRKVFEVNTKATLGSWHGGMGQTNINKLFHTMDLPNFDSKLYKNHERIIGPVVEAVAKKSCSKAVAMERVLIEENIEELKKLLPQHLQDGFLVVNIDSPTDTRPTVRIFVSYDMGWSQRGNGHVYDSLNGYCAIIGLKTGKIFDFCTRNRKCRACDSVKKTGKSVPHDCRLNFYGSAKVMEADGAVQLVTKCNILKDANVQVGAFIGDNDSCSISSILKVSQHEIVKQSDMNHSTKGVGNILHEIHKDKSKDPDGELSHETIKHIQRCFTYAIHQNKGDIPKVREALLNIPYHLFDDHTKCGKWCKGVVDQENVASIRLQNKVLFKILKQEFLEFSENATQYAAAASSQANESLNNSMASRAPKRISYSISESADFRFACTIAEKNLGTEYLKRSLDLLNVNSSEKLEHFIIKTDSKKLRRKEKANEPETKKKRLNLKAKRTQLKNQNEISEGTMYENNMGLRNSEGVNSGSCVEIHEDLSTNYESDNFYIVFFDLETAGLSYKHEILQISMKCGKYIFETFITPTRIIQPATTKVNGLSSVHKKLFKNGHEVKSLPHRVALQKLLQFLQSFAKRCILVAHNCSFDSTRLILSLKNVSLVSEFETVIEGFCDTLQLFRTVLPKRKSGYKLTTLASELLSLSCEGAHDARFDVELLEKLTVTYISIDSIIENKKSIQEISNEMDNQEKIKSIMITYESMGPVISKAVKKRLSSFGISLNTITESYKNSGKSLTISLLRNEINGKPQIIKSKKIVDTIIGYLENL